VTCNFSNFPLTITLVLVYIQVFIYKGYNIWKKNIIPTVLFLIKYRRRWGIRTTGA
jgi:hypothetical protein